jgi:hypothetical protein
MRQTKPFVTPEDLAEVFGVTVEDFYRLVLTDAGCCPHQRQESAARHTAGHKRGPSGRGGRARRSFGLFPVLRPVSSAPPVSKQVLVQRRLRRRQQSAVYEFPWARPAQENRRLDRKRAAHWAPALGQISPETPRIDT